MDRSTLLKIVKPPIQTVILCKNGIKLLKPKEDSNEESKSDIDPSPLDSTLKKEDMHDVYTGDVCPALFDPKFPDFVKTANGYGYGFDSDKLPYHDGFKNEWATIFPTVEPVNPALITGVDITRKSANSSDLPQLLFIKRPLPTHATYDYFNNLNGKYNSLLDTLYSANDTILSKELISEILNFLPFSFPIFISCASAYRCTGNYTHWVYPYTKSKSNVLEYLEQCEEYFDGLALSKHCYYESKWYIMKNDFVDAAFFKDYRSDLASLETTLEIPYNKDTMEVIYNEPILVAKKTDCDKLKEVIQDRNNVGGSYWLNMEWKKSDDNVEWLPDIRNNAKGDDKMQNVKRFFGMKSGANEELEKINALKEVNARIGGSCGIKSRCYYQTNEISMNYLPMSVVNVVCSAQVFKH